MLSCGMKTIRIKMPRFFFEKCLVQRFQMPSFFEALVTITKARQVQITPHSWSIFAMSFAAAFKSKVAARPEAFAAGIDNSSCAKKADDDPSRFIDTDGRIMSAAEVAARAVDVELDHMHQEVRMI